ncbi:hypothetical protein KKF82_08320 [Patescibacteria group bacterium]|nr:hypothetical protein [Patescibacteria group bacterium]
MSGKNLEDMTPDEMEGLLIEGIGEGHLEFAGMKDGEISVSLTGHGEKHIQELLGGVDVAEVTHTLYNLLVKHGALGFTVEANFINFTIIAQIMSIVKHYENWGALVLATK